MVTPAATAQYAIGACLNCRNLFLVTPANPECILCGRPPTLTLPFSNRETLSEVEPVLAPEPEALPAEPDVFELTCPWCRRAVNLIVSTEGFFLAETDIAAAEEEPAGEMPKEDVAISSPAPERADSLPFEPETEETADQETPGS